jgi:N-acetylglucosamine-6-sulfatase
MPVSIDRRGVLLAGSCRAFSLYSWAAAAEATVPQTKPDLRLARRPGAKPKNIMVVLTDDHRYDALGFTKA